MQKKFLMTTVCMIVSFLALAQTDTQPAQNLANTNVTSSTTSTDKPITDVEGNIIQIDAPAKTALQESLKWANDATALPVAGKNGRVVFTYGRSVPTIVCAPLSLTALELEPGEIINELNASDTVRWEFTPSIVGTGDASRVVVVIKPKDTGLRANLVITTDRRIYTIRLVSSEDKYVFLASFTYPDTQRRLFAAQRAEMQARLAKQEALVVAEMPNISVDNLRFNYESTIVSGTGKFLPVRVFDDGAKTYIQMPEGMRTNEAPAFMIVGHDGKEQLVNYRVKHNYYVIDRLFDRAILVAGVSGGEDKILITHCNRRGFFGGCAI